MTHPLALYVSNHAGRIALEACGRRRGPAPRQFPSGGGIGAERRQIQGSDWPISNMDRATASPPASSGCAVSVVVTNPSGGRRLPVQQRRRAPRVGLADGSGLQEPRPRRRPWRTWRAPVDELIADGVTLEQYSDGPFATDEKGLARMGGDVAAWVKVPTATSWP